MDDVSCLGRLCRVVVFESDRGSGIKMPLDPRGPLCRPQGRMYAAEGKTVFHASPRRCRVIIISLASSSVHEEVN